MIQDGVKASKSNRQMFNEYHEAICKKLDTAPSMKMEIIYDEIIDYLTFIRKMRPNDKSLSFIDDIKKDSFSLSSEIAKRGLDAVNDYIKAVNIARDYFSIKEHSDKSVSSLVGVNNESFVKEKFIIHVAYCYEQLKAKNTQTKEDAFLSDLRVLTKNVDESISELRNKYKLNENDFSLIGGAYNINIDALR